MRGGQMGMGMTGAGDGRLRHRFGWLATSSEFFGAAQVLLIHRTAPAVLAEVGGRLDEFFKRLGMGFDEALFLEGAQGFIFCIAHGWLLSVAHGKETVPSIGPGMRRRYVGDGGE